MRLRSSDLLVFILVALSLTGLQSIAGAEELMFFADDHYKILGEPVLYASVVNPAVSVEPGENCGLKVILANVGRVEELMPINGNGSKSDIALEMEEEQNCVDAQNITARLYGDEGINVAPGYCHINSLPSGSVMPMDFGLHIDSGASGWHDLILNLDYEHQVDVSVFDGLASPLYQQDNSSQVLRILVEGPESPLSILRVKSDLIPGRMGGITAIVKNSGRDTLRDCTLRLIAVPPFHPAEDGSRLGDLMPGNMAVARFPLEVGTDAGLQEYRLVCEVLHMDGTEMISFPVAVKKGSDPGRIFFQIMMVCLIAAGFTGMILIFKSRRTRGLRRRGLWRR